MSDTEFAKLFAAIPERDAEQLRSLIVASEFVLISIGEEDDGEENVAALTAEVGDFDVLVVFTSEQNASHFVGEMGELFEDEEDVEGVVVEGDALLGYLPDGFGLLINPEVEEANVIDPTLVTEILNAGA